MSRKRHSVDQVIGKLRQADVELGQGKTVEEACRVLEQPRSSYRHRRHSRKGESRNRRLLLEMRRISRANPRYGVPRISRELKPKAGE
jgi:hypothetical protein